MVNICRSHAERRQARGSIPRSGKIFCLFALHPSSHCNLVFCKRYHLRDGHNHLDSIHAPPWVASQQFLVVADTWKAGWLGDFGNFWPRPGNGGRRHPLSQAWPTRLRLHSSAASTRPLCSSLRANILHLREAGVIGISRSYCGFGGLELRPQLQNVGLEPDTRPCRTRPRSVRFYFEVEV
jgi:hypothetical protein